MDKIWQSIKLSFKNIYLLTVGIFLLAVSIWLTYIYLDFYQNHFYPQIFVDDVLVSGLSLEEAKTRILKNSKNKNEASYSLMIHYDPQDPEQTAITIPLERNLDKTLEDAMNIGHQGSVWKKMKEIVISQWQNNNFYSQLSFDESLVKEKLAQLAFYFDQEKKLASAKLAYSDSPSSLSIDPGESGRQLQVNESLEMANTRLERAFIKLEESEFGITALVASTSAKLNAEQIETAEKIAQQYVGQELIFEHDYEKVRLNDQTLIELLAFDDGINSAEIRDDLLSEKVATIAAKIDRQPQDAQFSYQEKKNGQLEIEEFIPDQLGRELNQAALQGQIKGAMQKIAELDKENNDENEPIFKYQLPLETKAAEITLSETNDLGINEIIGFGESWYFHSIPARVHNVEVAAKTINHYLIPPGKEFSLNLALGEVSTRTGYQTAYIIQDGATKLAPGGGVCQISSTVFRAVLNAGLKVTRRLPHSYRVSYYEINNEPGFDATVYSGNTDLRFINDTPGHILLELETDGPNRYMFVKIYGTSDGRTTEIVDYKKWGYRPALAPVYIPDPSLAPGQLKQIDWASSGIKAEFTNVVRDKDGELIREDYYYSSYQPWSAKYLQGV